MGKTLEAAAVFEEADTLWREGRDSYDRINRDRQAAEEAARNADDALLALKARQAHEVAVAEALCLDRHQSLQTLTDEMTAAYAKISVLAERRQTAKGNMDSAAES